MWGNGTPTSRAKKTRGIYKKKWRTLSVTPTKVPDDGGKKTNVGAGESVVSDAGRQKFAQAHLGVGS